MIPKQYRIYYASENEFIPQWRWQTWWGELLGWEKWYNNYRTPSGTLVVNTIYFNTKSKALDYIVHEKELRRAKYEEKHKLKQFKPRVVWKSI